MDKEKDFWTRLPDAKKDRADMANEPEVWELTNSRRALLEKLKDGEWVEGTTDVAAPWTFVCCHRAGWVERARINSKVHYRIADDGLAIINT